MGTGRSVVGAAVTGHGKAKSGGGSLRNVKVAPASSSASSQAPEQRRSLKAKPSMLAGVADRSARFEQC